MIRLVIANELRDQIYKTFKQDAKKVYTLLSTLKGQPNKGKLLAMIGTMLLKELRFKSFRFYFIVDGNKLYLFNAGKLKELLIKFLAMSKKHDQQQTIEDIKRMLEQLR